MTRYSLDRLQVLIRDWKARHQIGNKPEAQLDKIIDETFELDESLAQDDLEASKVELGDVIVACFVMAESLGSNATECVNMAWDKIKDRTSERVHRENTP